jgi:hypothetical protein
MGSLSGVTLNGRARTTATTWNLTTNPFAITSSGFPNGGWNLTVQGYAAAGSAVFKQYCPPVSAPCGSDPAGLRRRRLRAACRLSDDQDAQRGLDDRHNHARLSMQRHRLHRRRRHGGQDRLGVDQRPRRRLADLRLRGPVARHPHHAS